MFKTSDFNFNLPSNLIANEPYHNKEETPLLVFKNNQIFDPKIINILDYFDDGDVMIFNQVKVIKAKLRGIVERNSCLIDFNLDQELDDESWQALCKPAKKINQDDKIILADNFLCKVVEKNIDGFIKIKFY